MLWIPLYTEIKRNIPHLKLLLENSSDGLGVGLLKKIKPHRAQPLTWESQLSGSLRRETY